MVILLYLLFPLIAFAGDFTSAVNRNPTNVGEGVTLTLTLSNTTPRGHPAIESLREDFVIHSQQQSNSFYMENGKTTASTVWHLTLIPQKAGKLIIPQISIATDKGILSTDTIALQVTNEKTEQQDVSLITTASNRKPFKNETILYTVSLSSTHHLNNITLDTIALEDAIVELAERPKVEKQIVNGVNTNVVEYNYLITPLKPGTLIIPALALQGEIPLRSKGGHRDIFSMMQGFDQIKPFVLNTERIQLEVAPPESDVTPWLPAESIVIKEVMGSTPLQAFEPITRNFEIYGTGVLAAQLPDLTDRQNSKSFKTYSDKPELKNEFLKGKILSSRKESYTLIPQSEGNLTLPGISIEWWDTKNNKKTITSIAPRPVHVLPSSRTAPQTPEASPEVIAVNQPQSPILYALIGGLATLLLLAIIGVITLQRQITKLKAPAVKKAPLPQPVLFTPKPPKEKKDKKDKLPDLNPT